MKKFGLGSKKDKSEDGADESSRSKLFGKKKDKAGSSVNPYAAQASSSGNPYAQSSQNDPYNKASSINSGYAPSMASYNSNGNPPPYGRSGDYAGFVDERTDNRGGFSEKSPVPPGGYGGGPRFNNSGSGAQSGYGASDPYGASSSLQPPQHSGGYGGLGRTNSNQTTTTEAARDDLFGGAKQRAQQRQQHEQQSQLPPEEADQQGSGFNSGLGGAGGYSEYGQYHERAMTAEEEENEDVNATKDQIRFLKQQDVSSTRNALRIAAQAEETGRSTLERLGQQGESLHNSEKNLKIAQGQNKLAEAKARELKHLNRSMWAIQTSNPFTKNRREQERLDTIERDHQADRSERQALRAAAYQQQMRAQQNAKSGREGVTVPLKKPGNAAERSKYQFEADSEDEQMEDEIDRNLDELSLATGRLNVLGKAMGKEVDAQNKLIGNISNRAEDVEDHIVINSARLDRIK